MKDDKIKIYVEGNGIKKSENPITYISCDCQHAILRIEKESGEDMVYMSFYEYGHYRHQGFWHRLRLIWHIMTTGEPYGDDLVLNQESINKMVEFLKNVYKQN